MSNNDKIIFNPESEITRSLLDTVGFTIDDLINIFSEKENKNLEDYQVFIIDTIGILTKIYCYADVAYVGGGYTKSGVHNVLEPATFGVPIIIGPNYNKFNEAIELVKNEACFVVDDLQKLSVLLGEFLLSNDKRLEAGKRAQDYVKNKAGATNKILNYLK